MIWNILPFRMIDLIVAVTKLLTGAQAVWRDKSMPERQRIYFANHTSNLDTIVIWSSLPSCLREKTRPVAAKDYWDNPGIRRHIATQELNVVFIERNGSSGDPLEPLRKALQEGYSLIIFPEGQRNQENVPGAFKSGIFKLYEEFPEVDFIPVYLENVSKSFPRGAPFPTPFICKAHFGLPFKPDLSKKDGLDAPIDRKEFLKHARLRVVELIPEHIKFSTPGFDDKVHNPPIRDH